MPNCYPNTDQMINQKLIRTALQLCCLKHIALKVQIPSKTQRTFLGIVRKKNLSKKINQ